MSKRRMIDAQIWQSESACTLSMRQRLLWIGLITTADDQGRGRAHAGLVRSSIFPFDDIPLDEIQSDLQALVDGGMILLYKVASKTLYQVVKWWEYQTPQWATRSDLSPPEGWTDRIRCRHQKRYCAFNWPGTNDTVDVHLNPLPGSAEPSPGRSPEAFARADRDRGSDSDSDSDNGTPTGADAPPTDSQAMFTTIAEVCGIDWRVCTEKQRGALNQSEKRLRKAGATVTEMRRFASWWSNYDWRGKKGEHPSPVQVREEWGKFKAWRAEQRTSVPPPVKERAPPTPQQVLWDTALSELQGQMTKATFKKVFSSTRINGNDNGTVRVLASNDSQLDWLTQRLHDQVLNVLQGIDDGITQVVFELPAT